MKEYQSETAELQAALGQLRLPGLRQNLDQILADAARRKLTHRSFLLEICRTEQANRTSRREIMHTKIARFPYVRDLEGFEFSSCPSVDETQIRELSHCGYAALTENLLFLGPPGVGKTHLAVALGRCAIREGYTVLFTTAAALVANLLKGQEEKKLEERLSWYAKPRVLIVDELGYLRFEKHAADVLFQLVSRRYERGSIILTSNRPIEEWGDVLGDSVVATAILDRILHHSQVFTMRGDSYRLKTMRKRKGVLERPALPGVQAT